MKWYSCSSCFMSSPRLRITGPCAQKSSSCDHIQGRHLASRSSDVARGVYGSDGQVFLINDATITGTVSIAIAEIYAMVHPSTSVQYSILSYSTMSDPNMDSSQLSEACPHNSTVHLTRHATHTGTCAPRRHLPRGGVKSSRAAHLQPRMTMRCHAPPSPSGRRRQRRRRRRRWQRRSTRPGTLGSGVR